MVDRGFLASNCSFSFIYHELEIGATYLRERCLNLTPPKLFIFEVNIYFRVINVIIFSHLQAIFYHRLGCTSSKHLFSLDEWFPLWEFVKNFYLSCMQELLAERGHFTCGYLGHHLSSTCLWRLALAHGEDFLGMLFFFTSIIIGGRRALFFTWAILKRIKRASC